MRIAHVTATFPPYYGGTGAVCYHNALELARRGYSVEVFTAAKSHDIAAYPAEITVHALPAAFCIGNAPLLPGLFGIKGFDIIHLHFPFYTGAEITRLAALRSHTPIIVTYHQDVLLSGWMGLVSKIHDKTLGTWVLQSAEHLLFTTLDYGGASHFNWLIEKMDTRIGELPNGVDANRFRPNLDGSPIREKYGISPDKKVFILVAGLDSAHYFKGVEIFLRALKQVDDQSLRLLIVGDGDLRCRYQQLAVSLEIADQVTFTGRVSDADLPLHYAAADVGVLPSVTMGEAFGVVLLEAMACGKPVIASNLPGVRTLVEDGVNGLQVIPGDAADLAEKMCKLSGDAFLRTEMGTQGRKKVEACYSWPRVVDRLEDVYRSVVG